MPYKPASVCHCGAVKKNGRCPRCSANYQRPNRTKFYGTREWKRTADEFRALKGGICAVCGGPGATHVDHIVPRADGGTDDFSNLQLLHHGCHSAKTLRETNERMRGLR
ncbi:MAG: HNH endonuclease [Caenispirillum sp.]|nr:HNH endonuclease [Caenispirillum sp.]